MHSPQNKRANLTVSKHFPMKSYVCSTRKFKIIGTANMITGSKCKQIMGKRCPTLFTFPPPLFKVFPRIQYEIVNSIPHPSPIESFCDQTITAFESLICLVVAGCPISVTVMEVTAPAGLTPASGSCQSTSWTGGMIRTLTST